MTERESWDWDTKEKCITDVNEWRKKFPIVRLVFVVSFFRILLTNPNWDIRKFFHLSVAHGIVSIEANFGS
jgi:hypothetical protein